VKFTIRSLILVPAQKLRLGWLPRRGAGPAEVHFVGSCGVRLLGEEAHTVDGATPAVEVTVDRALLHGRGGGAVEVGEADEGGSCWRDECLRHIDHEQRRNKRGD